MATITYIEVNGDTHQVEVTEGNSLMQGAVDNMIPGILAECGGSCSCATCHIYVDKAWIDKTGEAEEYEQEMVAALSDSAENSRLSCQIQVTEEMDGLIIHIPESQF